MEIKTEKYSIIYDSATATITCQGSLMLNGTEEYEPILQLFKVAVHQQQSLRVDLKSLKFLNSSGINMMTKFVLYLDDVKPQNLNLTIIGQKNVAWQEKLLKNLQRLLSTLQTELQECPIGC